MQEKVEDKDAEMRLTSNVVNVKLRMQKDLLNGAKPNEQ